MTGDDKQRQRARYLHGAAREVERRRNQKARRRRGDDDDDAPRGRLRRTAEGWLDDGRQLADLAAFEKIRRASRPVEPARGAAGAAPIDGPSFAAIVVARHRDACEVTLDRRVAAGDVRPVRVPARPQDPELVVGDAVALAVDPADGSFRVARREPRRTLLERPDPGDPRARLAVAANVDVVVAVQSVDRARPGLIDRLRIAAERGGADLLVCVNKIDLAQAAHGDALQRLRAGSAVQRVVCVEVSAQSGAGIEALRAALAGRTCVFVGPSGTGKSSLCNALDPRLGLRIGEVRATDRKGRHTTTSSSLHRLAGDIVLIDTPGVRAFGLGEVSADELAAAFPDVARRAAACRFRDCAHDDEPDCAVRAAVAGGVLDAGRVAAWRRIRFAEP